MLVYFGSSNKGKLRELTAAASGTGIDVLPLPGLAEIAPPEETGDTFEDNAALKALFYSQFVSELVVADDSGLEVDALGGAPGVLSARYAGPLASDEENNRLLIRNLGSTRARAARFVCVVVAAQQGKLIGTGRGYAEGEILTEPRGSNGFGYDPLFFYPPFQRSFAELTPAEKLRVSHRGKAMNELLRFLSSRAATGGPVSPIH